MKTVARFLCAMALALVSPFTSAQSTEAPVRILPLGDSLTAGVSDNTVIGAYRNRLHSRLTTAGYNVDFVGTFTDASNPSLPDTQHQGQGSARIDQIQANLAGWLNAVEDPDAVLLMIGTNDFWQNYELGSVQTRLSNLIADIAAREPFAKILVATLPLRTDNANINAQQVDFNNALPGLVAQQAALGRQVSLVSMYPVLTAADLSPDGVHPNQTGFDKIGDAWFSAVASVVSPKGTSNPPVIARIAPITSPTQVSIIFSKPVSDDSANPAFFTISGGISVSAASLDPVSKRVITLTTSALTPGIVHALSISGVRDRTTAQTPIAPGSMAVFSLGALNNGGFENDLAGWTSNGNMQIKSAAPYVPTEGSRLLAFNTNQTAPNGVITQTFATTPGHSYQLAFDAGALGYNTNEQTLGLSVLGGSQLVADTIAIRAPGGGGTRWVARSYNFTANSATTTISFTDTSTTSDSIDLLLDNVRVGTQLGRSLAVTSGPDTGAAVTLSPADRGGNGNGTTGLIRDYNEGTSVTLTAPATYAGKNFMRWQRNGVDIPGSLPAITVTMNANQTFNAVYGSNNAPVAAADAYSTPAGTALTVPAPGVLHNDSDSDSPTLTAVLNAPPLNGTLNLNANGSFTYTPATGFSGTDSFSYHASDGVSISNVATVSITVYPSLAQLLVNGSFEADFTGWTRTGNMIIQSASPYVTTNGAKLNAFNAGGLAPGGTLTQTFPTVAGQTYQLAFDYGAFAYNTNTQRLEVKVDGTSSLINQTFSVTGISGGNTRWLSQALSFTANSASTTLSFRDTSTTGSGIDLVLDNVRVTGSVPNHTLTVESFPSTAVDIAVSPPDRNAAANGTTQFTRSYPQGTIVNLSAPANASGSAFVKWQRNGADLSTSRHINISIDTAATVTAIYGVNNAPVAAADSYNMLFNTSLNISPPGVLSNDSDADLNPITAALDSAPANGTLVLNPNGGFTYTPTNGFTGTDSFTYRASDGMTQSTPATVTINVAGLSPGTIANGSFELGETGWTMTGNRMVVDSAPPYNASQGTKLLVFNGLQSTPNGVISQTFATVAGQAYLLELNMGIVGATTTSQQLRVSLTGSSSLLARTETITGGGSAAARWVPLSYPFIANSNSTTLTLEDKSTTSNAVDLLVDNVRLATGNARSLTVASSLGNGVGVTVTPADYNGQTSGTTQFVRFYDENTNVTLTAPASHQGNNFLKWQRDGADHSTNRVTTVTIGANDLTMTAVYSVNSAPLAAADTYSMEMEGVLTVPAPGVLTNDSDVDSNPITASLVAGPSNGALTLNPDGSFTYTPVSGFSGQDSFTYRANDGALDSAPATVQITVIPFAPGTLVNGSFEDGQTGWTISGPFLVADPIGVYQPTNGSKLIVLNAGQVDIPSTVLSQTINTTPGKTYVLNFDMGVVASSTGAIGAQQSLRLIVTGSSELLNRTETITNTSTTVATWAPKSFSFVANSATTTISLRDISTTGRNRDLLLDNVRCAIRIVRNLTVNSSPEASLAVTVSPNDLSGAGNGSTPVTRTYDNGAVVTLTAPATSGAADFLKWTRNGIDFANTPSTSVTMNGDYTLTAVYGTNTAPTAVADAYTTEAGQALTINAPGILSNDSDPESTPLTTVAGSNPSNGTLTLNPNGSFTYTPNSGFTGTDSFTYRASDGALNSAPATVTISVQALAAGALVNGSFEQGETGWTITGNRLVTTPTGAYVPSDELKLLVLNAGQVAANAAVSQTFATTPGQAYVLELDMGAIGASTTTQSLRVSLLGSTTLLTQTETITGTPSGPVVWQPKSFAFTANSPSTTLTLADVSSTGTSIDLLVDNVRVNTAGTRTLTVTSPAAGLNVAVSPTDRAGNSNGTVRFNRFFSDGAVVTLSAPPTNNGGAFLKWTRNGSDFATNPTTPVTMDGNYTLAAIYSPPPQLLVNGSFENDFTGWTKTGNMEIQTGTLYVATDGTKIVAFNATQSQPNGVLSQTIPTIAGQTYQLAFDMGVLGYNTNSQVLQVAVTGTGTLISQNLSIRAVSGSLRWLPQAFSFVADSSSTTLTFRDLSTTTNSIDLLLDNVRLTGSSIPRTLTVASSPTSSLPIGVSPPDRDSLADGTTSFTRSYNHGAGVTLTAPATAGGLPFSKWQKNGVDFSGTRSMTLQLDGDHTFTAIYAPNTAPVASDDSFTVITGNTLTVTAPGVLGNDTDTELNPLTAATVTAPTNGSLTLNANGGFTYLPNTGFTGTDSFTYKANDGSNDSNTATVTISVNAAPNMTLTVNSSGASAVPVTVSPADAGSNTNGTTSFTRSYPQNTVVTLGAPTAVGTSTFVKWQRNGVDFANSTSTTVTLDASHVMTAVYQPATGTSLVVNGSFESGFTGWTRAGNIELQNAAPYIATDGVNLASFNASSTTPNGVLSQSFATIPGATYALSFDAGVLSYNTSPQTMQVAVSGNGPVLSQTVTVNRNSGNNIVWAPQLFAFVANSATTTIAFSDTSGVTAGIDLILDNVRVIQNTGLAPLPVLSVNTTPVSADITVTPNDANGRGNGSGSFGRVYAPGTSVTLTAPTTSGAVSFLKWQRNGVDLTTDATTTVTMDASQSLTALYSNPPFSNGSFETGTFAPWTTSGGTPDSVKINSVIGGTDGVRIVEFNSSNSPAGGTLSQTFVTTPGATYSLRFHLGVIAFNTNIQSLRVAVTGNGSLLNQTATISGIGGGTLKWEEKTYSFTANSTATTLTLTDVSTNTSSIDMLLDNVRVTNASARTLSVTAIAPGAVPFTLSPADNSGQGNGSTPLIRSYNLNTQVTVTAPATTNEATFVKWVKDGVDFATTPSTTLTMAADTSLVAIYSGGNYGAMGANLIQNGSFERTPDYAFWTASGATRIEKPGPAYTTDGNQLLSFNVGGGANDGTVSQGFNTTPGTLYTLQLDPGVFGATSIDQTLNIRVIGVGVLLTRNVTIRGVPNVFVWSPQTLTFVADSTRTTLHLSDASTSGMGTDLFVDNVRVRAGVLPPSVLSVNSTPAPGKAITVGTPDLAGQSNGTTNFNRIYNTGTSVPMVAPHQNFVKWLKNGQWYATNPSINVLVDGSHTMTAVYTETPVLGPFVNGSFEGEFTGWTWTGSQQSVKVKDGLAATDGLYVIEFNSNNSGNDGAISQTFTTTPGTLYRVTFDMGVLAANTSRQTLEVSIAGTSNLLTQSYSMNGNGTGVIAWTNRSVQFTANSPTTTITFRDRSTVTGGLDLLLDNVRLNGSTGGTGVASPTQTLTVNATPSNGAAITVSPADRNNQANGTAQFTRSYNTGTVVTLTAPATYAGNNFVKWQRDGSDFATTATTTVTLNQAYTMTAVYASPPTLASFLNGSFEQGLTSWTSAGSTNTVAVDNAIPATNGTNVVKFNSANSPNDGSITQTFATTAGTTYTVAFDIGVLAFNTSQQVLRVTATGNASLANQTFSINGTGNGNVVWSARTLTFTADRSTTTLVFRDQSTTGTGLDLLLDNIRVLLPAPAPAPAAAPAPEMMASMGTTGSEEAVLPDKASVATTESGTRVIRLEASEPGRYFLECSEDLIEWHPHPESSQDITAPGPVEFQHSTTSPCMFYRVGRTPLPAE